MFQDGLFKGKKILITGGGTGLGRGMAQRLLILGAEIAICGRRKGLCDETAEALMKAHGGVVKAYGVDIRDAPAVEAMIDEIFRDGPLTSLVNNAAGNFIARTEDLSPRGFDAIANIVMHGTFYVTQAVGKRWIKGGHRGSVVSITVTWVRNGGPFVAPSAMSKAAIDAMTKSLAVEWGRYGIRLNAIAPGEIPTEGMSKRLAPGKDSPSGRRRSIPSAASGGSRSSRTSRLSCFPTAASGSPAKRSLWTARKRLRPAATSTNCANGATRTGRRLARRSRRRTRGTAHSAGEIGWPFGRRDGLKLDDLFACTPSDEDVARPRGCLCNTPAFARLNAHLSSKFCRGGLDAAAGVFAAGADGSTAKAAASGRRTAFVNARVFDGKSDNLRTGLRVVIEAGRSGRSRLPMRPSARAARSSIPADGC